MDQSAHELIRQEIDLIDYFLGSALRQDVQSALLIVQILQKHRWNVGMGRIVLTWALYLHGAEADHEDGQSATRVIFKQLVDHWTSPLHIQFSSLSQHQGKSKWMISARSQ